jgi:hypothetical protein
MTLYAANTDAIMRFTYVDGETQIMVPGNHRKLRLTVTEDAILAKALERKSGSSISGSSAHNRGISIEDSVAKFARLRERCRVLFPASACFKGQQAYERPAGDGRGAAGL